ncbi:MAG: hypothetical protein LC789_16860 [Actinobacteria bacterium]|nr:hypothetical protein [Actinomycetota bacterium]MCA1722211.1 hypothetical protein [Actinomycetota bacterium]
MWVPGFRRVWRRREIGLYAAAQVGALLLVLGYGLRGSVVSAGVNLVWLVGFGIAYAYEGRVRARRSAPAR